MISLFTEIRNANSRSRGLRFLPTRAVGFALVCSAEAGPACRKIGGTAFGVSYLVRYRKR